MKNFSRALLIVAAIFASAGIGLTAAGAVMGGSISYIQDMEYLRNGFSRLENFTEG